MLPYIHPPLYSLTCVAVIGYDIILYKKGDDMDERKYLVDTVSKITGISKDTLRFGDKIGLLKPKCVDPNNNYRYYIYDQFWSIDIITFCRSLNIPIEKIRSIMESNDCHLLYLCLCGIGLCIDCITCSGFFACAEMEQRYGLPADW